MKVCVGNAKKHIRTAVVPGRTILNPSKAGTLKKRIIGNGGHKIISYQVNRCPLFVKTERRGNKNDSETID